MDPYDYAKRDGIRSVTWEEFGALTRTLAERLADEGIDLVVGIARTGLLPAAAVASALRCDLVPIQLSRRVKEAVVHDSPVWKAPVPDTVSGLVVAIVDEMTDTASRRPGRCCEKTRTPRSALQTAGAPSFENGQWRRSRSSTATRGRWRSPWGPA